MPAVAPPPAPVKSAAPARRRAGHALDEPRPDLRIGLVGTILVHVALVAVFFALPEDWLDADSTQVTSDASRSFEIDLTPLTGEPPPPLDVAKDLAEILKKLPPAPKPEEKKEPEDPVRFFISANTLAPVDTPDDTPFITDQSQQVAQPDAAFSGSNNLPAVQTEQKEEGKALVTGTLIRERASVSEQFEDAFRNTTEDDMEAEYSPAPKLRVEAAAGASSADAKGEDEAANATKLGQDGSGPKIHAPQAGVDNGRVDGEGYFAKSPKIDRNQPMARQRLVLKSVPDASPSFTIKNLDGTTRRGALAADARWSEFGDYYGKLRDSIGFEWENNLMNSRFLPTPGAKVTVVFVINSAGEIEDIKEVSGDGSSTTEYLCVSAITNRAPYGPWTQGMIDVLGEKQTMTFTFHF